jgi:hypothetical protein
VRRRPDHGGARQRGRARGRTRHAAELDPPIRQLARDPGLIAAIRASTEATLAHLLLDGFTLGISALRRPPPLPTARAERAEGSSQR